MIETFFYDIAIVKVGKAPDGAGGSETARNPSGVTFKGCINQIRSGEVIRAGQRTANVVARLSAEISAPIRYGVEVQDRTGTKYRIVSQPGDAGSRGHHLTADLEVVV